MEKEELDKLNAKMEVDAELIQELGEELTECKQLLERMAGALKWANNELSGNIEAWQVIEENEKIISDYEQLNKQ